MARVSWSRDRQPPNSLHHKEHDMNTTNSKLAPVVTSLSRSEQNRAIGERLIPATACLYPPHVNANDLLLVDLDRRTIEYGALYLVEEIDAGEIVWMGCRRFDRHQGRTVVDLTGDGEWQDFEALPVRWRIAGEVRQVFKPSI